MLTVHVRKGLLGEDGVATQQIPFVSGLNPRQIALHLMDQLPKSIPIDVAVNGHLIEDDYDQPLNDGDEVVLCPHTLAGIDWVAYLVYALIVAVISAGVNFAIQALTPKPKAPDDSFERGDQTSATYSWQGIRTNYGQGWTIPAVYGRHAVGGQVVESNVQASGNTTYLNDRLQILLALSEGPIHAIGDKEVSVDDFLGSLNFVYEPTNPLPVPSDIYVNDTLLVDDGVQPVEEWSVDFGPYQWSPSTPDVNVGDVVYFWNQTTGQVFTPSPSIYVTQVVGNSTNPDIFISAPIPGVVSSWIAGLENVQLQTSPTANTQPLRKIASNSTFNIGIEGSAGALVFCRSGELNQPPLPNTVNNPTFPGAIGWDNTTAVVGVNQPLDGFGQTVEVGYDTGAEELAGVRFIVSFPGGLFTSDAQGQPTSFGLRFAFKWRYAGDTVWNLMGTFLVTENAPSVFARQYDMTFGTLGTVSGELEFQCERLTGQGPSGTSSRMVLRDIALVSPYELTYPRTALLGLILSANGRFNGGMPQVQARLDGILVRVWDATNGWSGRCWDVPAAPFNWHTYPPGRNPAWVLADFLLQPWGLGQYLTEDDLDLPSFARWAVWCDRDPNPSDPWGEAQFTCDIVIDKPRPGWEWVLAICAAGRASPVFVNGKLSIVYQYRDAHSQGSVSVAAKTPTQLFTSGNMSDVNVQWLPRANRPTAFVYQFLNEDENYRQDVLNVEDAEGTLNDPTELHQDKWRPEQQQAFGITRPSQLFRDGVFRHRVNRLVTRRIDFKTGRWALAAQIGDLIDVETEVMRPFGGFVPTSGVILIGGTNVGTVTVDHTELTGNGQLKYRKDDGSPGVVTWTATTTTTVDLTPATELTLSSNITVDSGAACVFGTVDKLVETYEVVAITLNEDLSRQVTAVEYVSEVHDDIDPDAYQAGTDFRSVTVASSATSPDIQPESYTVGVERQTDGTQRISWSTPGLVAGTTKRVYQRTQTGQPWTLLGTTEHDHLDVVGLRLDQDTELSVVVEHFDGEAKQPDQGVKATVRATEFSRHLTPQVQGVEVGDKSQLRWSPVTTPLAEEYEVREGTSWVGARVLYRGTQPFVDWVVPPLTDSVLVCVEDEDGSQGQPTSVALSPWSPDGSSTFVDSDDVQDGATGTHVGTELVGTSYIQLTTGTLSGSYTTPALDCGFKATFLWRLASDVHELDGVLVDDVTDRLGSGELNWRTVDAREASRYQLGVDFTRDVDDATSPVDQYQDEVVAGYIGAAGHNTRALIEGRFYDGAAWSDWETWVDGYRNAEQAQVRVTLDRATLTHEIQLNKLRVVAHL